MTKQFTETEFRQMLASLTARVIISDAQVMADPKKYLSQMGDHCNELLRVLEAVERALSPDFVFDWALEHNMRPVDVRGEALIRCNAALKILREYKQ